jgi:hypothetical protein
VEGDFEATVGVVINNSVRKHEKAKKKFVRPQQLAVARLTVLLRINVRTGVGASGAHWSMGEQGVNFGKYSLYLLFL